MDGHDGIHPGRALSEDVMDCKLILQEEQSEEQLRLLITSHV